MQEPDPILTEVELHLRKLEEELQDCRTGKDRARIFAAYAALFRDLHDVRGWLAVSEFGTYYARPSASYIRQLYGMREHLGIVACFAKVGEPQNRNAPVFVNFSLLCHTMARRGKPITASPKPDPNHEPPQRQDRP